MINERSISVYLDRWMDVIGLNKCLYEYMDG